MRLPRDVSGEELSRLLSRLGYEVVRQSGSHIRLSRGGEHQITIPRHRDLKVGTISGIIKDLADHLEMSRDEIVSSLWG